MRLKINSLTIRELPPDDENHYARHRQSYGGVKLKPGESVVIADLVNAAHHDCDFCVEMPLQDLPEGARLGSELELEFKLLKK